jgi:hypothetical protein
MLSLLILGALSTPAPPRFLSSCGRRASEEESSSPAVTTPGATERLWGGIASVDAPETRECDSAHGKSYGEGSFTWVYPIAESGCYRLDAYNADATCGFDEKRVLDVDWCLGKHATIPYGGETVGWSTIGYWWLQQEHPPVELHQAHGKVDAFRWVYTGDKCEHAGELVQLHLDADFDTVDSAFLDDAGAMFPWARVLGVSKGSIVIDLELQPGTEPPAEMVQEAASLACARVNAGPQCTTSAVLRKPRPVSAEEEDEENFAAVEDPEEEETVEEEEPASPTRAPHATQEETYSISEDAAAREEDAMVAMASKNSVVEQEIEEALGVSPMALALGSCGGLVVLITAAFAAWLKLRVARERYAAKDVEKGVVVEEQKPADSKEDELDDNASTATPDSLAQSVESRRESLAMDIASP